MGKDKLHTVFLGDIFNTHKIKNAHLFGRFIWTDGVHGWRIGLKNQRRPFDSGSVHQTRIFNMSCSPHQDNKKIHSKLTK